MRYNANFIQNATNAVKAEDKYLVQALVIDQIADIIETHPEVMANTLTESGVSVFSPTDKKELVNKVSYSIVNNRDFQKNIAVLIAYKQEGRLEGGNLPPKEAYSNQGGGEVGGVAETIGGSTAQGASSGGVAGGIVGAILGTIKSGFDWGKSKNEAKSEEEITKRALYAKLFGGEKKTNWVPIVVIGGVLAIGGVVLFLTLRK